MDEDAHETAGIGVPRPIDEPAFMPKAKLEIEIVERLPIEAKGELATYHASEVKGARASEDGFRERVNRIFARGAGKVRFEIDADGFGADSKFALQQEFGLLEAELGGFDLERAPCR